MVFKRFLTIAKWYFIAVSVAAHLYIIGLPLLMYAVVYLLVPR